jgi:hypothetical protein
MYKLTTDVVCWKGVKGVFTTVDIDLKTWLADLLRGRGLLTEDGNASIEAERQSTIKRRVLNNILDGTKEAPEARTLMQLARWGRTDPLVVIRMAGVDVDGLEFATIEECRAIALTLKRQSPAFNEFVDDLLAAPLEESELKAMLGVLRSLRPKPPGPDR